MTAQLIALLSALGLVATGGAAVATVSVVNSTVQAQELSAQDEKVAELEMRLQELLGEGPAKDGAEGPAGPSGPSGVDGEDGAKGAKGEMGMQGAKGEQGLDGEKGLDGAHGEQGVQGEQGVVGPAGTDGADGADGTDGTDGANGRDAERYVQGFYWIAPSVQAIPASTASSLLQPQFGASTAGTGNLATLAGDGTLTFTARIPGTYLVSYSLVAPTTGPSALTQTAVIKSGGALVPGSVGTLYTSTGSQTSASFYLHLDDGDSFTLVGSTAGVGTFLSFIPSVNIQVIEFDEGVEYCESMCPVFG